MDIKKNIKKVLIRWCIILLALVAVFFWKRQAITESLGEIKKIPWWLNVLMAIFAVANLFAVGYMNSRMTRGSEEAFCAEEENASVKKNKNQEKKYPVTFMRGVVCAFFCEFYRLLTLGVATGLAQIYYYKRHGIDAGRGTGICLVQYTVQKMAIGILGLISFVILLLGGQKEVAKESGWILLAILAYLIVIAVLMAISMSEKVMKLALKLLSLLLKKHPEKLEEYSGQIRAFNQEGRVVYRDRKKIIMVFLSSFIKQICWYMVPAVMLYYTNHMNILLTLAMMSVVLLVSGVMLAPAGVGTFEYCFSLLFKPLVGVATISAVILYRFYTWIIPFFLGGIIAAYFHVPKNDKKDSQKISA